MEQHVSISRGNVKMGAIPSVSLPPIITCSKEACKHCGKKCYALKIARLRPKRESFCKDVLEPACGGGHISNVLDANGYNVESVDIVNRGYQGQHTSEDFFKRKETWNGDIVTNPPYKFAAEFVEHALDVTAEGHKIAMFLKLTFLEGEKKTQTFPEQSTKEDLRFHQAYQLYFER